MNRHLQKLLVSGENHCANFNKTSNTELFLEQIYLKPKIIRILNNNGISFVKDLIAKDKDTLCDLEFEGKSISKKNRDEIVSIVNALWLDFKQPTPETIVPAFSFNPGNANHFLSQFITPDIIDDFINIRKTIGGPATKVLGDAILKHVLMPTGKNYSDFIIYAEYLKPFEEFLKKFAADVFNKTQVLEEQLYPQPFYKNEAFILYVFLLNSDSLYASLNKENLYNLSVQILDHVQKCISSNITLLIDFRKTIYEPYGANINAINKQVHEYKRRYGPATFFPFILSSADLDICKQIDKVFNNFLIHDNALSAKSILQLKEMIACHVLFCLKREDYTSLTLSKDLCELGLNIKTLEEILMNIYNTEMMKRYKSGTSHKQETDCKKETGFAPTPDLQQDVDFYVTGALFTLNGKVVTEEKDIIVKDVIDCIKRRIIIGQIINCYESPQYRNIARAAYDLFKNYGE